MIVKWKRNFVFIKKRLNALGRLDKHKFITSVANNRNLGKNTMHDWRKNNRKFL